MTNEEKILARLDELSQEIQDIKRAARPVIELKHDLEPIVAQAFQDVISRLGGLDRHFSIEDIGDMVGQFLVSSKNLTGALKSLNRALEFRDDFAPLTKTMFHDVVGSLDEAGKVFDPNDLRELLRQTTLNMGNISETLKTLNSLMEFKKDAATLTKLAFDDIVTRLDDLKKRGIFDALNDALALAERMGEKAKAVDLNKAQPIKGVFGMLGALKRPEVQEGLGILIELSTMVTALKPSQA